MINYTLNNFLENIKEDISKVYKITKRGVSGILSGIGEGIVAGSIGVFAMPSLINRLNNHIKEVSEQLNTEYKTESLEDKVQISGFLTGLYSMISIIDGFTVYSIIKDIVDGDGFGMAYLLIPNLISLGYELYKKNNRKNYSIPQ